ncbi:MAG: ABC transporter ATP-binding protein [Desulfobacteraceae bacterium]
MSFLSIKNLSTSFKTKREEIPILLGLSYSINAGEILGIVGESGSGKTMSVLTMLGLIPDKNYRINSGKIIFFEKNLLEQNDNELRDIRGKDITMIFQDSLSALNPYLTIRTQLMEALSRLEISNEEKLEKCIDMLKWVGFSDAEEKINSYPFELSGGMRQRISIAMALLPEPKLIIADEPTSSIDATLSKHILSLFKKINLEKKISIIFISHNFSHVAFISQRILVMYGGRAMEIGAAKDILSKASHPYTRALLDSIPLAGSSITSLPFIPGDPPDLNEMGKDACPFHPRCKFTTDECRTSFPDKAINNDKEIYCHHPLNQS